MIKDTDLTRLDLKGLILSDKIKLGGNMKLKIYGSLSCSSGKRMRKQNLVFFSAEKEAITAGFRPCGHCLREKYLEWIEQGSG